MHNAFTLRAAFKPEAEDGSPVFLVRDDLAMENLAVARRVESVEVHPRRQNRICLPRVALAPLLFELRLPAGIVPSRLISCCLPHP
jgi:hypothetical protein